MRKHKLPLLLSPLLVLLLLQLLLKLCTSKDFEPKPSPVFGWSGEVNSPLIYLIDKQCLSQLLSPPGEWFPCIWALKGDFFLNDGTDTKPPSLIPGEKLSAQLCCEFWGQFECLQKGFNQNEPTCKSQAPAVAKEFEQLRTKSLSDYCSPMKHHCANGGELNLTDADQWWIGLSRAAYAVVQLRAQYPNCSQLTDTSTDGKYSCNLAHIDLSDLEPAEMMSAGMMLKNSTTSTSSNFTCTDLYSMLDCARRDVHAQLSNLTDDDCNGAVPKIDRDVFDVMHTAAEEYLCRKVSPQGQPVPGIKDGGSGDDKDGNHNGTGAHGDHGGSGGGGVTKIVGVNLFTLYVIAFLVTVFNHNHN